MKEIQAGRHKIGSIGVDSGQMMLCDPCYIGGYWGEREWDEKALEAMQKSNKFEFNYLGACAATLSPANAGILENEIGANLGAVCSSGYGDGLYDVFIEVTDDGEWGKRITKLEIVFIGKGE